MLGTWKDYDVYFNEDREEIAFYKRGEYKFGIGPKEISDFALAIRGFWETHQALEDEKVAKKAKELGIK